MKTIKIQSTLCAECRAALRQFWDEQLAVEPSGDGAIIALPLMYPDGLQVVLEVQPLSASSAILSDRGNTLTSLFATGFNLDPRAKQTYGLFQERTQTFEMMQDGFVLKKEIKLPVNGIDLHLFGEALVSIAHLIYRHEPDTAVENVADRTVRKILKERQITPKEGAILSGKVEKKIRVDYYLEGRRPFAIEVIKRRGSNLGYIEQWAWRWTDLKNQNDALLRAMIYDPDLQEMDTTVLEIGHSVCELFCPYFETEALHAMLGEVLSGR